MPKYPQPETKRCPACTETKPVSEFYRAAAGMPGYRPYCKPCHKAKRKADYDKAGGKDVPYEQLIKRKYGITLVDYNAQLARQAHRCAVCRRPETNRARNGQPIRLSVDHDHVTGRLRGLLCQRCSLLVWAFEENHAILGLIDRYVEDFRASFRA